MTRDMCKFILPVIQAFADGEYIEYWDNTQLVGLSGRGMWKTSDNIGFGVNISRYRMIKDDTAYYFDGREPSKTFSQIKF